MIKDFSARGTRFAGRSSRRHMIALFVALLLILQPAYLLPAAQAEPEGGLNGSGTSDDPYEIWTADDLNKVRNDLGAYYELKADIDLSGIGNWVPIGWNGMFHQEFQGHLEGNGRTISNLTFTFESDAGLFGIIGTNGVVQNFELSNVNGVSTDYLGSVGALAGMLYGKAINIRVSDATITGNNFAGGLAGSTDNGAVIEGSCVHADVSGESNAGGLVGYLMETVVKESCATGTASGSMFAGGLAGLTEDSEFIDSYAIVTVNGGAAGGLIGGISMFGSSPTILTRVYAAGKVSGDYFNSGGLIGSMIGPYTLNNAYYDSEATGKSGEGIPLTSGQMLDEASFIGWDFDTVWNLDDRDKRPSLLRLDITAPAMTGAEITADHPDQVAVYFPEAMIADDDALLRFTVTVGGDEVGIADRQLNGKTLVLTLAEPVIGGQKVAVSYTDANPAITDKAHNRMPSHAIEADNKLVKPLTIEFVAPADNATGVAADADLVMTFSDPVEAVSGKFIYLTDEGGAVAAQIEASSSMVNIEGQSVVISLDADLRPLTSYYVRIDAGAFRTLEGLEHGGIADPSEWDFVTAPDPLAKWVPAGNEGFTEGKAESPVLKAGADGTLYALFRDTAHGGKATVMKLGKNEAEWTPVGNAGFSPGAIGGASLLVDGNVLYSAFGVVDSNNLASVHVMKYEPDGAGDWTPAGDPIAVGTFSADHLYDQDSDPHLYKHEGTVYIAYRDGTLTGAMTVKKLGAGGNWEIIGNAKFSEGDIFDPSLAAADGTLYAGFTDYTASAGFGATVMKYNSGSGKWQLAGSRGFTSGNAFDTSLVSDGNRLFVVYENGAHMASAMMFDFASGEWVPAGGVFSADQAYGIAAAAEHGGLFAAYQEFNGPIFVKKYAGSGWFALGTSPVSPGKASSPSLAVHDGIVYVVYEDATSGGKLSVMKYGVFNSPPKVKNVQIEGKLRAGETVNGTYSFEDDDNDNEGESSYRWYTADDHKGKNKKIIAGATERRLEITKALIGKYLIFEVTPAAAQGAPQGRSVSSAPAGPVVPPEAPDAPNVTADDVRNIIVGADATMEYSTDDGVTYSPYDPSNPPTFAGNVTVKVRVAANEETGAPAGAATTLTFTQNASSGGWIYFPVDPEPNDAGVTVLVNGKEEHAGTATISERNGQSVMTIAIDPAKLEERLAKEGLRAVVTIAVPSGSDVVVGELNGQIVKNMGDKQAVLEIKTERATYSIPAQQINIGVIFSQIGTPVALEDIKIQVEIGEPTADAVRLAEHAASDGMFTIVAPPVYFAVRAEYDGEIVEITKFSAFVERTIAIPDDADPGKITTGVVIEPDGTPRHVPTKIVAVDGKYYAVMNSLTNSVYAVVWHPVEFSDVAEHWAKVPVNNMGSRMIIQGTGGGQFSPDREITRAEFAAIIVRSLGLGTEGGPGVFADVRETDWYNNAICTAYANGLLNGFEDGTFRPNDKITREQAMVIISKAMAVTGLKEELPGGMADAALGAFTDAAQVSAWAAGGVADSVRAGIVSGRDGNLLAPLDFITRAEAAAMIERLLMKSDLI